MARSRGLVAACMVLLVLFAWTTASPAQSLIQRTITIDGNLSDWTSPTNILTNSMQSSSDLVGTGDADAPVQSSGRDLRSFAYTWDNNNLYLFVERAGSANNVTDWWFYVDTNANGLMQSGEKVLHVSWQGSNRSTAREICDYVSSASAGDPLVSPGTGVADGYDMPGTVTGCSALAGATGGSSNGVQMEAALPWSALGFTGPSAVGFHVSSSNGTNIPTQIDDNMDGPGGNFLFFADNSIAKTASVSSVAAGQTFTYTLTLQNLAATTSSQIVVSDVLPTGVNYVSHSAPVGTTASFSAATRTLTWNVATINATSSLVLTITVTAGLVPVNTTVTNTAQITSLDSNATNNSGSVAVNVIAASFTLLKSVVVVSDPINLTLNPKSIPGAISEYTLTTTNFGGQADASNVRIIDVVPTHTKLYVGDIGGSGSGPVGFSNGATTSGLTYTFSGLGSGSDSVEFSSDGGTTWNYTPVPGSDGCDGNVTHVRITPAGTFAIGFGVTPAPSFQIRFRVCIR